MFAPKRKSDLPLTVEEAVSVILGDLSLRDRTRLASMRAVELDLVHREVGGQFAKDFGLWTGNDVLLAECLIAAHRDKRPCEPTQVILHAVWQRLQQTHVLRLVKS